MFTNLSTPEKVVEKAHKLVEKGKIDKAVQCCETALTRDPRNIQLLLALGELYCRIQDPQAASREYRKAFKADPDQGRVILRVLAHPPGRIDRSEFFELRLEVMIHMRDLKAALALIGETGAEALTRLLERTRKRTEELQKLSVEGQNVLLMNELRYMTALILEGQGAYGEAFTAYSTVLKAREEEWLWILPRLEQILGHIRNEAVPHLYLGSLLRRSKPERAAAYYDRALDLDSKSAPTVIQHFEDSAEVPWELWVLGKAYLMVKAWDPGVACLQAIHDPALEARTMALLKRVNPALEGVEPVLLLLGDRLRDAGNFEEASKTYGLLHGRVDGGQLRERFQRLVELDPENVSTARTFGEICLDEGDMAGSIAQMRKIVQSDPSQRPSFFEKSFAMLPDHFDDPELSLFLAELCLEDPDVARPVVLLRRFIRLTPDSPECALLLLKKLADRSADHPSVSLATAEALIALGRDQEALRSLQLAAAGEALLLREVLRHLSLLLRKSPALGAAIVAFLQELEAAGMGEPGLDLVWAEAAMACSDQQEAVSRLMRCVGDCPEQNAAVAELLDEWEQGHPHEHRVVLARAELCFRTGRYEAVGETLDAYLSTHPEAIGKVIPFYREMIRQRPEETSLHQGMVKAYYLGGTYDMVLEEGAKLEQTLEGPPLASIHQCMGDACKEMGRFTEAVKYYFQAFKEDSAIAGDAAERLQQVLDMNPTLPKASLALGLVLSSCNRVADGVECLLRLVRDVPQSSSTVMKYLKQISVNHPVAVEPILGMAELHILAGTFETALDLLWKAIQRDANQSASILRLLDQVAAKNPGLARTHLEMGKVYLKVGLCAKAAHHFLQAVEKDLTLSEQAIKFCHDILAVDPSELKAYATVTTIMLRLQRPAAAAQFLSSASTTHPKMRDTLLPQLEALEKAAPDSAEVVKVLAWNYFEADRIDAAVGAMERAIALEPVMVSDGEAFFNAVLEKHPEHGHARLQRGSCRLHKLDLPGAFEDVRVALEANPDGSTGGLELLEALREHGLRGTEFLGFVGDLYAGRKEHALAIELYQEALEGSQESAEKMELLIRLAEVHERLGQTDAVRGDLTAARELASDQSLYYQKVTEFALKRIHRDVRAFQEEAAGDQPLSEERLKQFISQLILLGRDTEAEEWVRRQTRYRDARTTREIWGHYYEQVGNYAMAVQLQTPEDRSHQLYLLEQAGYALPATVLLEDMLNENPDPMLQHRLNGACSLLMEESLLGARRPLVGKTRLKIYDLPSAG